MLEVLPVARLSTDRSGIGMNVAENLARDPADRRRNVTNEAKERWATDFKILLQRREVLFPRDRDLVAQCTRSRSGARKRGRSRSTRSAPREGGTRTGLGDALERKSGRGERTEVRVRVRVIGQERRRRKLGY